MERDELLHIIRDVDFEVNAILKAQQTLAGVHSAIRLNQAHPFEQDLIYYEQYGSFPSQSKTQVINGVLINTHILHQIGVGLRDVSGADFLYEIVGEKYVLVQYKTPKPRTVTIDAEQLDSFIEGCPLHPIGDLNDEFLRMRIMGWCGSWYSLITANGSRFVQACEIRALLGDGDSVPRSSFEKSLSKETFVELFASCRLGAPTNPRALERMIRFAVREKRVVLSVRQFGRFGGTAQS